MNSDIPHDNQPDSGLSIASMVCGVMSLTGAGPILGIPAIILGTISLRRRKGGRQLSIVGIVTGSISTSITLLLIAFIAWIVLTQDTPTLIFPAPQTGTPLYQPSQT